MQPTIRLIATDMDGTLLNSKKQMPAGFIPWVKAHPHIRTVIASGRQYYTLARDFAEIADQLLFVAENGGLVFEHGEILYANPMRDEDILATLDMAEKFANVTPILCGAKSAYMRHTAPHIEAQGHTYYARMTFTENLRACVGTDTIVKLALFVDDFGAESLYRRLTAPNDRLELVLSGDSWIDVDNRSVSKGSAMAAIQQKLNIAPAHCAAFGDYLNDYTLLQACGESYCMANGHPDLKAIAKYIAPSCDEEGVMQILETLA